MSKAWKYRDSPGRNFTQLRDEITFGDKEDNTEDLNLWPQVL